MKLLEFLLPIFALGAIGYGLVRLGMSIQKGRDSFTRTKVLHRMGLTDDAPDQLDEAIQIMRELRSYRDLDGQFNFLTEDTGSKVDAWIRNYNDKQKEIAS